MRVRYWGFFSVCFVTLSLLAGVVAIEPSLAIKRVPTTHKVVAITFDDGPHPLTTPALLTVLGVKQAKATFFVLGSQVKEYPELAGAIVHNGQELASHSYHHRYLNKLTPAELAEELDESEKVIAAVGPRPTLIRPPGGGYNDRLVRALRERGYTTVLWTIDPRDWAGGSSQRIANTVLGQIKPGSIVLLHEGECAAATPAAVGLIIDMLRNQGYELVTVSELLQYYEVRP
ncbi:MAG: polysaccharide deacetylase family protein [Negativicutes bacterium]|nr:polysaccharide deacetylase family protein [Negativicutes bacterium]